MNIPWNRGTELLMEILPMRIVLVLVLVLASSLSAQQPTGPIRPTPEKPAPSQPFGSMRVHVEDSKGTPVPAALVAIEKLDRAHETGETGDVLLAWVPVGKHELKITKSGYKAARIEAMVEQEGIAVVTVKLQPDGK